MRTKADQRMRFRQLADTRCGRVGGAIGAAAFYWKESPLEGIADSVVPAAGGRFSKAVVGDAASHDHKNVHVNPSDTKLGCAPAALKRSYSARTAQAPNLT